MHSFSDGQSSPCAGRERHVAHPSVALPLQAPQPPNAAHVTASASVIIALCRLLLADAMTTGGDSFQSLFSAP